MKTNKLIKLYFLLFLFLISSFSCKEKDINNKKIAENLINQAKLNVYFQKSSLFDSVYHYSMGLLKQAEEIDSSNYEIYYYKHLLYRNAGKYDSALFSIEKSIEVNSEEPYSYFNLAYLHDFLGNTEKANLNYKKSLETFNKNTNSKGKEFLFASSKVFLIDILFGKDSALKYYDLMKSKYKIFDIDSSLKKSLLKYNHKQSIKEQFR